MGLLASDVIDILERMSNVIAENKEYLTELDSAIGDADHGINMTKGFGAVKDKLKEFKTKNVENIGDILKITGMTLVSTVGGASGPLYGTAFLKAALAVMGKNEVDIGDFRNIMEGALAGVKMRGKAEINDKTMIDVLEPAVVALRDSCDKNISEVDILNNVRLAALQGMEYTKSIQARKGRASYLGARSIGHQDPGATSSYLLLNAIYETVKELKEKEL